MRRYFLIILIVFGFLSCNVKTNTKYDSTTKVEFNQELADELTKMAEVDQLAASNAFPPEDYKYLSQENWIAFKDSIYTTHQRRLEEIFIKYGYPGYDLVGKKGSNSFWLMTQHADFNPNFQYKILKKLEIEVKNNNADGRNFGLLTDRVRLNTGQKQIYGSQVDYNVETCQAFPRNLEDSINVNKRRDEVGLEPIEEYLNMMSKLNFDMNKELYLSKGINGPKLYETK